MKIKTLLLCTIALSVGASASYAQALGSGPRYTPRPEIAQKNYTHENRAEDRMDKNSYEQYEQREPCQNYRKPPRGYDGSCMNEEEMPVVVASTQVMEDTRLLPIIRSYTVLFDFDKSAIRTDEHETLRKIMQEINKYNPRQVTVTGYTDSSGSVDYNQTLSRTREQAVSKALLERGIANRTLERDARGEYDQAVQTADGTKNQKNRRVVIDFRR